MKKDIKYVQVVSENRKKATELAKIINPLKEGTMKQIVNVIKKSLFALLICLVLTTAAFAGDESVNWTINSGETLELHISGISSLNKIEGLLFNGEDVMDFVLDGVSKGDVKKSKKNVHDIEDFKGLTLTFSSIDWSDPGILTVIYKDGRQTDIEMVGNPFAETQFLPDELTDQADDVPYFISAMSPQSASCNGVYSSGNPYPCCANGGNCTHYTWYRARSSYRGWNMSLPAWSHAKYWAAKAASDGRFYVTSYPRAKYNSSKPYSIAVRTSTTGTPYGHVAWLFDYNSSYAFVDEGLCDDTAPFLPKTRISKTYSRSYFQFYVSRK